MDNSVVKYSKDDEAGELYLGSEGSAGIDLCCKESGTIACGETKLVGTGLRFELPPGKFMMIVPRSSLGLKTDVTIPNSPGIIDSDYRGEVGLILRQGYPIAFFSSLIMSIGIFIFIAGCSLSIINNTEWNSLTKSIFEAIMICTFFICSVWSVVVHSTIFGFKYNKGDRLAQMIILDYQSSNLLLVDELIETKRGEGGFGSTGIS